MGGCRSVRSVTAAAIVVVVAALGAGCSNEGDVQTRWVEAYGAPDGVDRLRHVDCQEPFPGTLEGCSVTIDLLDDADAATVTAIVERYAELAPEVYEGAEGDTALGSLVLAGPTARAYLFSPRPDERGGSLRATPDADAVDAFVRTRDDDRFREVRITDEARGARAVVELAGDDPAPLFRSITTFATEFERLEGATFQARIAGGESLGVASVAVTTEDGRVPDAEWRFALTAVEAERGQGFDVRVSPGSVHLVAVVDPAVEPDDRLEDVAVLRERIVARAPASIDVTVGSRPRRS